ncbi:MAG: hypothetical protein V1891_00980 [bacterium]
MEKIFSFYGGAYNWIFETVSYFVKLEFLGPIQESAAGRGLLWGFTQILGIVASALILAYFFPKASLKISEDSLEKFLKSFIIGLAVFLLAPIFSIVFFATVIGIIPGAIIFLAYGYLVLVSVVYAGIIFGNFLMRIFKGNKNADNTWYSAAIGAALLFLIGLIPIAGWAACSLVFLAALGSLSSYYFGKLFKFI